MIGTEILVYGCVTKIKTILYEIQIMETKVFYLFRYLYIYNCNCNFEKHLVEII